MNRVVGLVPAAGQAKRIAPLPGSKELLPVGFHRTVVNGQVRVHPKVVSHYLLEAMARAGARKVYVVIGKEKTDLMRYYGDGADLGISLAYLVIGHMGGMPYTLNQARPWLSDETVIFGMPDTIFSPSDAFSQLLDRHAESRADLTLGLFPTDKHRRFGMVAVDEQDRVVRVVDKPAQTDLKFMWGIACWSPRFTQFMGDYLPNPPSGGREIVLGDIFQAAVDAQFNVRAVRFVDGDYIDIGTPEDLSSAIQRFSQLPQ